MKPLPRPAFALNVALGVSVGQHSSAGRKAHNQDFHGALIPRQPQLAAKGVVLALADGIGSSAVSGEASEAAVHAVLDDYYCTSDAWSVKRSMQRVLAAMNSWLHAQTQRSAFRHDHDRGWVCALAVLVLKGRSAHIFHAGDVRVWRASGASLELLTEDHRVYIGGGQSYLSRALGFRPALELDYQCLPLELGDVFMLACDGVHEHVGEAAMLRTVRDNAGDLDAAARTIVQQAFDAGSGDNLTVQVLRVDSLPEAEAPEARRMRDDLQPAPLLQPRAVLDGYRIERELHGSSRSHVYLATDLGTGEKVVLKTPSVDLSADAAYLDRLMMEEWIARRIHSAHVLQSRSRSGARSHLYLAMEYIEGRTLAQWMRDNPAPGIEAVREIIEQVARGLQAFHRLEMLHQDLRPENIMVDASGTAKIIDFGSVRVAGLADSPGANDALLGTLQYTAPECLLGETASERSDLFSLGVIAYQMLCGRLPYGAELPAVRTRTDVARLSYSSVLDERSAVPAWIDPVLAKAVHPAPGKRYEALSEFVHDLRHGPSAPTRRVPLAERHPARLWQAVAAVLAVVAIVQLALLQSRGAAQPAPSLTSIAKPRT